MLGGGKHACRPEVRERLGEQMRDLIELLRADQGGGGRAAAARHLWRGRAGQARRWRHLGIGDGDGVRLGRRGRRGRGGGGGRGQRGQRGGEQRGGGERQRE